jgi:hypothetical protein
VTPHPPSISLAKAEAPRRIGSRSFQKNGCRLVPPEAADAPGGTSGVVTGALRTSASRSRFHNVRSVCESGRDSRPRCGRRVCGTEDIETRAPKAPWPRQRYRGACPGW